MIEPQKVEIVRAEMGFVGSLFVALFVIAYRTLIVWWAVAVWFPQFGLTYWQTILPVYAAACLFIGSGELKRTFKPKSWALPKVAA